MHVSMVVEHIRWHDGTVRGAHGSRVHNLHLANGDAARQGPRISEDPVVGDFQVMVIAVGKDAATALGRVGEAYAIDARGVAKEVGLVELGEAVAVPARSGTV